MRPCEFFFGHVGKSSYFCRRNVNLKKKIIMGKTTGSPLNPWRGRVGGQVYAVNGGMQVIRTYNPVVANPRTSLQQAQRAKVVLAGKLSSLTPDAVLTGMASSKRDRRSEFTRNIIIKAIANDTPKGYKAILEPADLIFAKGRSNPDFTATIEAEGNSAVSVTVTKGSSIDAVMLVAVEYNGALLEYTLVNYELATSFDAPTRIALSGRSLTGNVNVYGIPLTRKSNVGSVRSDGVSREGDGYGAILDLTNPDIYDYAESFHVGSVVISAS